MNLRGRVGRLEGRCAGTHRGPRACGSCGFPLPVSVEPAVVRFVVPPPRLIGEPEDDPSGDVCSACGRRLVYRLLPPRQVGADA